MPEVYIYKKDNIVVHADGPHDDVFTFQMTMRRFDAAGVEEKTESFYQRTSAGWKFLNEGKWFSILPRLVPKQVVQSRIQYGLGDIKEQRRLK